MKKVLLAFDGLNFSEDAFPILNKLNKQSPILLVGLFLPQVNFGNVWSYAAAGGSGENFLPLMEKEDLEVVVENIDRFETLCRTKHIRYSVHKDFKGFALPELIRETRFADLLIICSKTFYKERPDEGQYQYLRDTLHGSECPVLVVPESCEYPEQVILAVDESPESVYAIKQFSYLFPEWSDQHTVVVHADEKESEEWPSKDQLKELVELHFHDLEYLKLRIDPKRFFNVWVSELKKPLLVSGSFSRSAFSEVFKKSFVKDMIREGRFPVFIAHTN